MPSKCGYALHCKCHTCCLTSVIPRHKFKSNFFIAILFLIFDLTGNGITILSPNSCWHLLKFRRLRKNSLSGSLPHLHYYKSIVKTEHYLGKYLTWCWLVHLVLNGPVVIFCHCLGDLNEDSMSCWCVFSTHVCGTESYAFLESMHAVHRFVCRPTCSLRLAPLVLVLIHFSSLTWPSMLYRGKWLSSSWMEMPLSDWLS